MVDNVHLTRDAAALLIRIYQRYLNSRHDGFDDLSSRYIGNTRDVINLFSLDHDECYVTDLLFELDEAGYISAELGDNLAHECTLQRAGIARVQSVWSDVIGFSVKTLTDCKRFSEKCEAHIPLSVLARISVKVQPCEFLFACRVTPSVFCLRIVRARRLRACRVFLRVAKIPDLFLHFPSATSFYAKLLLVNKIYHTRRCLSTIIFSF